MSSVKAGLFFVAKITWCFSIRLIYIKKSKKRQILIKKCK